MITNIPGVLLTARTADCVPVLFWDEENNAVGAAHCGWRGTVQELQVKTVQKMREIYGTNPKNLKAAIGPCISKCCYEVSEEFYENFVNALGERVKIFFEPVGDAHPGVPRKQQRPPQSPPQSQPQSQQRPLIEICGSPGVRPLQGNKKYMCDLKGINKMLLLTGGKTPPLREENIEVSPDCTCCDERFFSHRRQGENRNGTHASFIGIL